jgi:hypothetical protein
LWFLFSVCSHYIWGKHLQDIKKAGVGCSGDAQKLMRDFGLACQGMFDLGEEANLRMCGPNLGRLPEHWSLSSKSLLAGNHMLPAKSSEIDGQGRLDGKHELWQQA